MSDDEQTIPQLAREYEQAQKILDDYYDKQQAARAIRDEVAMRLAARIAPGDMSEGESIGVWTRVHKGLEKVYMVTWKRGKLRLWERGARDVTK